MLSRSERYSCQLPRVCLFSSRDFQKYLFSRLFSNYHTHYSERVPNGQILPFFFRASATTTHLSVSAFAENARGEREQGRLFPASIIGPVTPPRNRRLCTSEFPKSSCESFSHTSRYLLQVVRVPTNHWFVEKNIQSFSSPFYLTNTRENKDTITIT